MEDILNNIISKDSIKKLKPLSELTLVPNFFSSEECKLFIDIAKSQSLEILATKKRYQFDSTKLSDWMWKRMQPYYKYNSITDKYGNVWKAFGLNCHFRIIYYTKGDKFAKHEDGFYQSDYCTRSFATAMVYLNTIPEENGGATNFMEHGFKINGLEGLGCFFVVEDLMHCGEELKDGEKYLLRTDVMYKCENMSNKEKHEKLYELLSKAELLEDNGDSIGSAKIWKEYFDLKGTLKN